MKIILDIPDQLMNILTEKAININISAEDFIIEHLSELNNKHSHLEILLNKIDSLPSSTLFNVRNLMGKDWGRVHSPKSFGRDVRKHLIPLGYEMVKKGSRLFYRKP